MLLSARFLTDVVSVNSFHYSQQVEFFSGDGQLVYFQLIDASKNTPREGFVPQGLRYMPAAGSLLSCVLVNVDTAKTYTKVAVQPYPTSDPSIFYIQVLSSDTCVGTLTMKLVLSEGSMVKHSTIQGGILVKNSSIM